MKIVLIQMAVTDEEDYSLRMKKADGFLTEIESSAKKPDLILLDYEMPLFNGKPVLETLRENKDTSDIDGIVLTSVSDKKHIIEVMELKPAGYLLKPVARKSMLKAIEDVFSNKVSE